MTDEKKTSKPAQKAAQKTADKPVQKTVDKAAPKTASKPAAKTAPRTSAKPASKPADKPADRPAAKTGAKPGQKPAAKPGQKPSGSYGGDKGSKKNRPVRTKESTKRQPMLNTHKLAPFKYDMNEILSASRMDPAKASSFLASIIAKASRISTKEAKDFAKTFLDAEDLSKEEYDKICRLLDRYSKFR